MLRRQLFGETKGISIGTSEREVKANRKKRKKDGKYFEEPLPLLLLQTCIFLSDFAFPLLWLHLLGIITHLYQIVCPNGFLTDINGNILA